MPAQALIRKLKRPEVEAFLQGHPHQPNFTIADYEGEMLLLSFRERSEDIKGEDVEAKRSRLEEEKAAHSTLLQKIADADAVLIRKEYQELVAKEVKPKKA